MGINKKFINRYLPEWATMIEAMMHVGRAFLSNELGIEPGAVDDLTKEEILPFIVKQPYSRAIVEKEIVDGMPTSNFPRVIRIKLARIDGKVTLDSVDMVQYGLDLAPKLLAFESSGGAYMSPVMKLVAVAEKGKKGEAAQDQIQKGIVKLLGNMVKYFKSVKGDAVFTAIMGVLEAGAATIEEQALSLQLSIFPKGKATKKFNTLVTIQLDGKYPGELDEFTAPVLVKQFSEFKPGKSTAKSVEHVCSITGSKSTEITGGYKPYAFYTTDKPGYIAGGFDDKNAVKNFPVSFKAALLVEVGKRVLEEHLRFQLGGIKCFIVPKSTSMESLKIFLDRYSIENRTSIVSRKALEELSDDEELILSHLSGESNDLRFDFAFHETDAKGTFSFLLYLNDINPSRIHDIWNAIRAASEYDPTLKYYASNIAERPAHFSFRNLKAFCKDSTKDDNKDEVQKKKFLTMLQSLFLGSAVDWGVLVRAFFATYGVKRLQVRSMAQPPSDCVVLSWTIKDFIPIFLTYKKLGLLKNFN